MTDHDGTAAAAPSFPPTPSFPPGRYGRRREPRKPRPWLAVLLATLVAVAAGAIAYRLYRQYGSPEYTTRILAETGRSENQVTIRFEVRSRSGTRPAACRVRALTREGVVVGTAEVAVPAGKRVVQTYTLPTTRAPAVIDIPRCRSAAAAAVR